MSRLVHVSTQKIAFVLKLYGSGHIQSVWSRSKLCAHKTSEFVMHSGASGFRDLQARDNRSDSFFCRMYFFDLVFVCQHRPRVARFVFRVEHVVSVWYNNKEVKFHCAVFHFLKKPVVHKLSCVHRSEAWHVVPHGVVTDLSRGKR